METLKRKQSVTLCGGVTRKSRRKQYGIKIDDSSILNVINLNCGCKQNWCLKRLSRDCKRNDYQSTINLIKACRNEIKGMNYAEIRDHMRYKVSCYSQGRRGVSGRLDVIYKLPTMSSARYSSMVLTEVCSTAFIRAYDITSTMLKTIISELKNKVVNSTSNFHDRTAVSADLVQTIKTSCKEQNINLSREMHANLSVSNTELVLKARAWMKYHFSRVGDQIPNTNGEIHLEPQDKLEIYKEYLEISELLDEDKCISYSAFLRLWNVAFQHVKIRVYKQVTGKCMTCLHLSVLRKRYGDSYKRGLATELHAYHRLMYMGEKQAYYDRAQLAKTMPLSFMSLITDGMSQNHTQLPWLGNIKDFPVTLQQHLQGVIDHGDEFVVYRTFHNLKDDSNLALHVLLLQIEQKLLKSPSGSLPPELFLQIDGGSENANQYTLGLCELLIARGLFSKVTLTRLPVGHTHEDIDGKFGQIWLYARDQVILTPQQYEETIKTATGTGGRKVRVVDIFAVPDYKALFERCMDSELSCWTKNEDSQLQFLFERVQQCEQFPHGVKTQYRAFSCDEAIEIIPDRSPASQIGYTACVTQVESYPVEGTYFLLSLPTAAIRPTGFIVGSRAALDNTISKFKCNFSQRDDLIKQWESFAAICPPTDNVYDYITEANPLYVPLKDKLFSNLQFSQSFTVRPLQSNIRMLGNRPLLLARSTPSVRHHGNLTNVPRPRVLQSSSTNPAAHEVNVTFSLREPDRSDPYKSVTHRELQHQLTDLGLNSVGTKLELFERLERFKSQNVSSHNSATTNVSVIEGKERFTISQLKEQLIQAAQPSSGNKDVLYERLKSYRIRSLALASRVETARLESTTRESEYVLAVSSSSE